MGWFFSIEGGRWAMGRWDPEEKAWYVLYGSIRGISELEERILPD
jgi:hypothetical protein